MEAMRRSRCAKIIATLGPATSTLTRVAELFDAGADLFRLNFSHGSHDEHRTRYQLIRKLEEEAGRPIGILMDLQGPKFRIGRFADGPIKLIPGSPFRLDLMDEPGNSRRVTLPHPEIIEALTPGTMVLMDDGKLRLRVEKTGKDFVETIVSVGGELSDRKGVNIPDVIIPLSVLTEKDREDLEFGLELGIDWVALSFVQRPEDVTELQRLVDGRAKVMAKLEKPSAIDNLHGILKVSDAIMIARGDLGVEVPAEDVPGLQKWIIRECRKMGKPVVVATQMLDSMVRSPIPTRAEASDVATAVYDGVDAVMLSAETAAGDYPVESVSMMNRIIEKVEHDDHYMRLMETSRFVPEPTPADAITSAARHAAQTIGAAAIVTFTNSGSTTIRASRERPLVPILGLTPITHTARHLALAWGVHPVKTKDVESFVDMVNKASRVAKRESFAKEGDKIVVTAGVPFGTPGTTNALRIVRVGKNGAMSYDSKDQGE